MNRGVLLFSHSNGLYDYGKLAIECARRVKKYLEVPITIVTSDELPTGDYSVVHVEKPRSGNIRSFTNYHQADFLNGDRYSAYELSPYDKTLLIDVDYLLMTSDLSRVWEQEGFKIATNATTIHGQSINVAYDIVQVWATTILFDKSDISQRAFSLAKHVYLNWNFYAPFYGIPLTPIRNDFVFAIMIKLLERVYPGVETDLGVTLVTAGKNLNLIELTDQTARFEKYESTLITSDVHVINKESLYDHLCSR